MLEEILKNLRECGEKECYQINDKIYKYKDLYKYVCNIYEYLLKENNERKPVIVYGHKDIYMIASFLACSFAGITYIPIDETIPEVRKKYIFNQVSPNLIINKDIEKIMLRDNYNDINKIYLKPDDLYYIIFTSGSTGEPKGVKITYKNLQSCIVWLKEVCNILNGVILNQANFSFDLSVADIYLSLVTRSKHYILEKKIQNDYKLLFEELKNSRANLAVVTPSFVDLLLLDKSFNKEFMPNLKQILFCGEKLSKRTVEKLYERFPNIDIINCYGPTECTFAVTSMHVLKGCIEENISIGMPKKDTEIYIVNENLENLDDGKVGEILIVGESVGNGYVNDIIKDNGFIKFNEKKAYLTGDLGYIENQKLYYVGRKDNQIKYKGYRIELDEIESALYKLDYIEKAVVAITKDRDEKVNRIIAFVQLKYGVDKSLQQIKRDLKMYLPLFMCPVLKIISQIPLNANGKCNKKQLLEEYLNEG